MLFSPSSLGRYSSLEYFSSVVARQQELFGDIGRSPGVRRPILLSADTKLRDNTRRHVG